MRRWLAALTLVLSLAVACSLTTSLDGLSGAAADGLSNDAGAVSESGATADGSRTDGQNAGSSPYRDAVLADQPMGYWRFGESTPDTAIDEIGGHPGQYRQTNGLVVGVPGATSDGNTAVRFSGTGFIEMGDEFSFPNQPFSIELWLSPGPITSFPRLVSKERFEPQQGWHFEMNRDSRLSFGIHRNNDDVFVAREAIPRDVFTYCVVTYDLARLRMYIDGALVDDEPTTMTIINTDVPFTVGTDSNHDQGFNGVIDELAVYNKVLSPDRITAHHAAAKSPPPP